MIKKLILILLSIHFYNQTCIDKDVLLRMGLKPAETQKIESPEVCKKVLKVASSCVDVDDLEIYLKDYQEYQNKLAEEGYKKLEDTTEYLEEKYKSLETDPESAVAFTGETITAEIQSKIDGLKELAGDADENLDTDKERNDCMEATNRVAMGALCILISDKASEFVKEAENFVGGAATLTPLEGDARFAFNLVNPVSLKVNENSADEVVNKCAVTIRKACFQKKMNEINDELDGIENDEVDDEACLAAVCTENNSCSALAKSNMFQNKFGPKGNRNIDGDESEMSEKRKALNDELKKKIEEKLGDKGTQLTELREKLFTLKNELNAGDKTNKDEFEKLKAEYKILNDELKPIIKSARKEFHDANKTARDALKEERKKNQEQEKKEKPPLDDATKAILKEYQEDLKAFNDKTKALRKELNLKVQAEMEAINADTALTEAQKLEKIEAKKTELKTALEKEIAALKKALEEKTGLEDIKWKNKQKELKEKKEKTDEQKPKEGDKPAPKEETAARLGLNAVTTGGATFSYVVDNSGADVVAEAEELGVSTSGVDFSKLFAVIAFLTLF